jgi:hypothetical protein
VRDLARKLEAKPKLVGHRVAPAQHGLGWRQRVKGGVAFDRIEHACVALELLGRLGAGRMQTARAPTGTAEKVPANRHLAKMYVGLSKCGVPERPVDMTNRKSIIIGTVLAGLAALFLAFDAAMKLANVAPVRDAMAHVGYPTDLARILGAVLLVCVALYVNTRTAPLGAVLLTGWLGGAVATHVRIGDPLFSHVLAPVYFGALIWGGLYLRDDRVRALVR